MQRDFDLEIITFLVHNKQLSLSVCYDYNYQSVCFYKNSMDCATEFSSQAPVADMLSIQQKSMQCFRYQQKRQPK